MTKEIITDVLLGLAVLTVAAPVPLWPTLRLALGGFRRRSLRGGALRGCGGGLLRLAMVRPAMTRRTLMVGAAARTPDLDHLRFGGFRFGSRLGCSLGGRRSVGRRLLGLCFRRGCCRRCFDDRLGHHLGVGDQRRRFGLGRGLRGRLSGRSFGGRRGFRRRVDLRRLDRHFRFCRLRRLRTPVHAIAERAQDRGEVFARGAGQRGHRAGDGEAAAIERAVGLRAG